MLKNLKNMLMISLKRAEELKKRAHVFFHL